MNVMFISAVVDAIVPPGLKDSSSGLPPRLIISMISAYCLPATGTPPTVTRIKPGAKSRWCSACVPGFTPSTSVFPVCLFGVNLSPRDPGSVKLTAIGPSATGGTASEGALTGFGAFFIGSLLGAGAGVDSAGAGAGASAGALFCGFLATFGEAGAGAAMVAASSTGSPVRCSREIVGR